MCILLVGTLLVMRVPGRCPDLFLMLTSCFLEASTHMIDVPVHTQAQDPTVSGQD